MSSEINNLLTEKILRGLWKDYFEIMEAMSND